MQRSTLAGALPACPAVRGAPVCRRCCGATPSREAALDPPSHSPPPGRSPGTTALECGDSSPLSPGRGGCMGCEGRKGGQDVAPMEPPRQPPAGRSVCPAMHAILRPPHLATRTSKSEPFRADRPTATRPAAFRHDTTARPTGPARIGPPNGLRDWQAAETVPCYAGQQRLQRQRDPCTTSARPVVEGGTWWAKVRCRAPPLMGIESGRGPSPGRGPGPQTASTIRPIHTIPSRPRTSVVPASHTEAARHWSTEANSRNGGSARSKQANDKNVSITPRMRVLMRSAIGA